MTGINWNFIFRVCVDFMDAFTTKEAGYRTDQEVDYRTKHKPRPFDLDLDTES